MLGFSDAVASAGPYANNLHLAPDITTPTPHHSIFATSPANSVQALKVKHFAEKLMKMCNSEKVTHAVLA